MKGFYSWLNSNQKVRIIDLYYRTQY